MVMMPSSCCWGILHQLYFAFVDLIDLGETHFGEKKRADRQAMQAKPAKHDRRREPSLTPLTQLTMPNATPMPNETPRPAAPRDAQCGLRSCPIPAPLMPNEQFGAYQRSSPFIPKPNLTLTNAHSQAHTQCRPTAESPSSMSNAQPR